MLAAEQERSTPNPNPHPNPNPNPNPNPKQERPGAAHEAAIYACLSGRAAMQPALATKAVCAGWEDTLWAHAKLSVAEQLAALQAQINAAAPDAAPPRATPAALLPRLLDYASTSAATHGEAAEASRHHELQRALVLLRLVQLPGLRSADGVAAALQRFFAAAPGWAALFPNASATALDLLVKLMQFDPAKRLDAMAGLRCARVPLRHCGASL